MKLEIGVPNYEAKGLPGIMKACLRGRKVGKDVPLVVVTAKDMQEMHRARGAVRGCPVYVSYYAKEEEVWLHPTPDGEYILDFTPWKPAKLPSEKSSHTLTLPKRA